MDLPVASVSSEKEARPVEAVSDNCVFERMVSADTGRFHCTRLFMVRNYGFSSAVA